MKVFKDTPFEFGYLAWQVRPPQPALMVVIKGAFRLVPEGPCPVADEQAPCGGEAFYDDDPANSLRYDTDFAVLKPHAECYLVGTCHPPGGRPTGVSAVSFKVGAVSRSLAVFGDRHWTRSLLTGGLTEPAPFTAMPLRWERAFGGPGFDANPVGRGLAAVDTPHGRLVALPNLEDPRHLITAPSDRPHPAGAFPVPASWAVRTKKTGTYDHGWLETRWPWFPTDFDFTYFDTAPPELHHRGYWNGDEEVFAQNLHPEHAVIRCRLPGVRARAFLEVRRGERVDFEEVPLRLDTIVLDTDATRVLCLWRGLIEVPDQALQAVETLFYVHEPAGTVHSLDECRAWLQRKRDEAAREDADHEAEQPPGPDLDDVSTMFLSPPVDPLSATAKELEARAAASAAQPGPEAAMQAGIFKDLADQVRGLRAEPPPDPPAGKPSEVRAEMAAQGLPVAPELAAVPDPPAERPPRPEDEEAVPERPGRERVREAKEHGTPCAGMDLTAADLSGLDLSGMDFTGALLARADLQGCTLDGAVLDEAVLSGAVLDRASLVGTSLRGAVLSEAHGTGCNAERAVFEEATADASSFPQGCFVKASLKQADFTDARLEDGNFEEAVLDEADLTGARLDRGRFVRASLVEVRLDRASVKQGNFDDADLTKARVTEEADLDHASLVRIKGAGSLWEDLRGHGVNFSFATLDGADFSRARLVQANFGGCSLRSARFQEASLVNATIIKADVFEGDFEGADLAHADLRGSNFFGAQFWRARVDFAQLELANVQRTHLARPRKSSR